MRRAHVVMTVHNNASVNTSHNRRDTLSVLGTPRENTRIMTLERRAEISIENKRRAGGRVMTEHNVRNASLHSLSGSLNTEPLIRPPAHAFHTVRAVDGTRAAKDKHTVLADEEAISIGQEVDV
ncbi:hypothetical protein DAD186_13030 [Dermabacter vaginalis]|uniref:Uncharacterized protein n=2 Tax=Dermabacter vaginalis TaxID=1630135 RepID=A0A1B0ZIU7_9MICO|nr:hypothetical protein DAD186_13030 [Dermabacter vaginalis]